MNWLKLKFFKYESINRDLVLFLIDFVAEIAHSNLYIVSYFKKCSQSNDFQKLITVEVFGIDSSSNFIFSNEFIQIYVHKRLTKHNPQAYESQA